jgi:hypothetical protein
LEESEVQLLKRFQAERAAALEKLKDIKQLENQVNQAQATIRSLELQFTSHEGRASAFVDLLVPEEMQNEEVSGNGQDGAIKTVVLEKKEASAESAA